MGVLLDIDVMAGFAGSEIMTGIVVSDEQPFRVSFICEYVAFSKPVITTFPDEFAAMSSGVCATPFFL